MSISFLKAVILRSLDAGQQPLPELPPEILDPLLERYATQLHADNLARFAVMSRACRQAAHRAVSIINRTPAPAYYERCVARQLSNCRRRPTDPTVGRCCAKCPSMQLPEGLTSIGDDAFDGCTALKSIALPHSLTSIGYNAFYRCTALKSIALPHSLTSIGARAFSNCTALESVALPAGLASISAGAFSRCIALKLVSLPEGLVSIDEYAFLRCTSLSTINIPASVQRIGKYAFFTCPSLDDATFARIRDLDDNNYDSD